MATLVAGGTETYVDCPYSNNTVYVDEATGTKFLRQCGLNGLGADLTNSVAYSLNDCMARCANRNTYDPGACAAVVWIWAWDGDAHVPGQFSKFNWCYLKGPAYNKTIVWNWMAAVAVVIP
ncbi:hypothetical protein GQ53DRAFT_358311 [Thozetella sp. PMI_491]|nr:hypothetical protein GQ53DRAFT_358311 [Thozetella sp. PMI_491]